jgi:regulator of replication initiation timing
MSEFCSKCVEKEAQLEVIMTNFHKQIETLKARIEKLETENESLALDVAFYGGNVINLSCDDK